MDKFIIGKKLTDWIYCIYYIGYDNYQKMVFFKLTNEEEIQYERFRKDVSCQLVDGLNVYPDNYVGSDFNYTSAKNIFYFLSRGIRDDCAQTEIHDLDVNCTFYLRVVTIPDDVICNDDDSDNYGSSWSSKKIVLGERYLLNDPKTFEYLKSMGAIVWYHAMRWAARHGYLDVVKYIHSIESEIDINDLAYYESIEDAARCGQLEVLEYLLSVFSIGNRYRMLIIGKAIQHKQNHIVKHFLKPEDIVKYFQDPNNSAAERVLNQDNTVSYVIKGDGNSNDVEGYQSFLLGCATKFNNTDIIEYLSEIGLN